MDAEHADEYGFPHQRFPRSSAVAPSPLFIPATDGAGKHYSLPHFPNFLNQW